MGFDELYESLKDSTKDLTEMGPVNMDGQKKPLPEDGVDDLQGEEGIGGEEMVNPAGVEDPMPQAFNDLAAAEGLAGEVMGMVRDEVERYQKDYPDADYSPEGDFYKTLMEEIPKQIGMVFDVSAEADMEDSQSGGENEAESMPPKKETAYESKGKSGKKPVRIPKKD